MRVVRETPVSKTEREVRDDLHNLVSLAANPSHTPGLIDSRTSRHVSGLIVSYAGGQEFFVHVTEIKK